MYFHFFHQNIPPQKDSLSTWKFYEDVSLYTRNKDIKRAQIWIAKTMILQFVCIAQYVFLSQIFKGGFLGKESRNDFLNVSRRFDLVPSHGA